MYLQKKIIIKIKIKIKDMYIKMVTSLKTFKIIAVNTTLAHNYYNENKKNTLSYFVLFHLLIYSSYSSNSFTNFIYIQVNLGFEFKLIFQADKDVHWAQNTSRRTTVHAFYSGFASSAKAFSNEPKLRRSSRKVRHPF